MIEFITLFLGLLIDSQPVELAETLERLEVGDTVRAASGIAGLDEIIRQVAAELSSQTVVWVEGEHLPAEVLLSAAAPAEVALIR